ncbi:MAG: chromosome segregation protein SMC, partial [Syntrophomonadaceae bacterium]
MNLKRLEIKGFKTFADHTELDFHPGINIIVGPNGCGKSNIVDAIRWVMGEANVRALRGHRNEDVIFSGTDKHRALGMAQVEMTVDNNDGSLPLDYTEICISRKMFRSGESEFYLNKSRVRMKDIVRLYTDTGLGKKGYSIISQGELERVLNGQPFDRRLMLEEAAGTIRYRQQREEVEQRILQTSQDLLRVEDILAELGIRKAELFAKAQKARTYIDLKSELDDAEKRVLDRQMSDTSAALAARQAEILELQALLENSLAELATMESRLRINQEALESKRACLARIQELKHGSEKILGQWAADINLGQEKIRNCQARIENALRDREKYTLNLHKLGLDLSAKRNDWESERLEYITREAEIQALSQEIAALEQAAKDQERLFSDLRDMVFAKVQQEATIKNEMTTREDNLNRSRDKRERLLIRLAELQLQAENLQKSRAEMAVQSQELEAKRDIEQKLADEAQIQKDDCLQAIQGIEDEYRQIDREIHNREHRQNVLADLRASYVGFSEPVKNLYKACEQGEPRLQGLIGAVADLIEVPAGMELAFGLALGRGMENVIMESASAARSAIAYLKEHSLGRVTFLPLDLLRVKPAPLRNKEMVCAKPGVIGIGADLVRCESRLARAMEYLLGRVVVVQDLECALNIFQTIDFPWRIVTLEGDIINPSGAMTSGRGGGDTAGPLRRKQEEKNIKRELQQWFKVRESNREKALRQQQQALELEQILTKRRNRLAETEFQLKIVNDETDRLRLAQENSAGEENRYQMEIAELDYSIRQIKDEHIQLKEAHQALRAESQALNQRIESFKVVLTECRHDLAVKQERHSSYQEQLLMKRRELDTLEQHMGQFEQIIRSYEQSHGEAKALIEGLEQDIKDQIALINATHERVALKELELSKCRQEMALVQEDIAAISETIERDRADYGPVQARAEEQRQQMVAVELKKVRLDTEIEALNNQWQEKFPDQNREQPFENLTSRQIRDYRGRIPVLREQIDLLGPIDIESIKDY